MNPQFSLLLDRRYPIQLAALCEEIDLTGELLKQKGLKPMPATEKYFEWYGISLKSSKTDLSLFFGLWFDVWTDKGIPLCFTLEGNFKYQDLSKRILELCEKKPIPGAKVVEWDGVLTILLEDMFYQQSLNHKYFADLFIFFEENLNFGYVTLK